MRETQRTPTSKARAATRTRTASTRDAPTREGILRAAATIFAKHGYEGGSIDKITRAAKTHDRMIYYYFGSKESLYVEVLEEAYRYMSEAENALAVDLQKPQESLSQVVDFVWHYYLDHPEFMTLLNTENLRKGKAVSRSKRAKDYSSAAISLLDRILVSGRRARLFRTNIAARDLYLLIASMGYFYLSNRYTLSAFLGESTQSEIALEHWREFMHDVVRRTVGQQST